MASYKFLVCRDDGVRMKKREANFELLRIIAMLMIVCLHYLSKGEVLADIISVREFDTVIYWFIEALSIVSVNCFVLLSGYMVYNRKFRASKVVYIWAQTFFYALLIPIVLIGIGVIDVEDINIYKFMPYVFPISTSHYWFVTIYLLLYILSPLLNLAAEKLSKKEYKVIIIALLLIISVPKSIIPLPLELDDSGYGLVWFIIVYLIGAYIKKYGIKYLTSISKSLFVYIIGVLLMLSAITITDMLGEKYLFMQVASDKVFDYNHVLNLMASIGFFCLFANIRIVNKVFVKCVTIVSPYVLGVFLLHEHIDIRYRWVEWLDVKNEMSLILRLAHLIVSIILVFTAGILVDFIRTKLFSLFIKKKKTIQ